MTPAQADIFSILESITDGFFSLDHEMRFAYVNSRAGLLLGGSREDLVGERIWENPTFYPQYRRAVSEGKTMRFEGYHPALEAWYSVRAYYPLGSGLSVYFQDVMWRKEAPLGSGASGAGDLTLLMGGWGANSSVAPCEYWSSKKSEN